jgi:hypothetical protein
MTSGIIEILIENATVQSLVGVDGRGKYKVYPVFAPEGVSWPYVVVSEVSLNPTLAKGCPSDLDYPRYNVLVYSLDFRQTELIQAACRACLDTGSGFTTDAGAEFHSIYMVDRQDLFMPSQGEGPGMYVKVGVYAAEVRV